MNQHIIMRGIPNEHLPEDLIIKELKNNPKQTIPDFVAYFNQKYDSNESYNYIYYVIKTYNLWNFILKSKEHQTLDRLLQNQELRTLLFNYSGLNLNLKEITQIIYEELDFSITNYALKRIIKYYNLDFKDKNLHLSRANPLTERQKEKLIRYCKENGMDINNLTITNLLQMYKQFKYNYLEYVIFKSLLK